MFRFLFPFEDNTVLNIAIGARDLAGAFDQYRRYWHNPGLFGAIAVYHNAALVARVLPILNTETDELEPQLFEIGQP